MASLSKAINRDRKIQQRTGNKMRVDSRSVFLIQEEQRKRSQEIKQRREEKASLLVQE